MHGILAQEGGPLVVDFKLDGDHVSLGDLRDLAPRARVRVLPRSGGPRRTGGDREDEGDRPGDPGGREGLPVAPVPDAGIFLALLTILLFFILPAPDDAAHSAFSIKFGRSLAFILGAGFSALTGYVGMWLAVRANVRTANAARESGLSRALKIAFRVGGVAGMFTVGLGLLGATVILLIYKSDATSVLVGFGFGGALLAMFMRVGGGIFTKAADVGADLVGKVEQGSRKTTRATPP